MPDNQQSGDDVLPHLAGYIEQLGTPETLDEAIRQRDAWVESAAMFSRNEDYYRGLLDQIAAHIGPEAWKADNGDVVDDEPVRARLPDLVHSALSTVNVDEVKVAALTEAHRVALHHTNYGHIEGNRRAFVIADDIERRISAALSTKAPLSVEGLEG